MVKKDTKYLILLFALAIPYFWLKFQPKPGVETLLKPTAFDMDPDGSLAKRYAFYNNIDTLLLQKECAKADLLIDSMLDQTPHDNRLVDYKGLAFLCKGDARTSISYFNNAMKREGWKYSKALANRAQAYLSLKMFDSAVMDLKECTSINYDFSKDLAIVYEQAGNIDSAIKYYDLFLSHYPDSLRIKEMANRLKKKNS